MERLVEVVSADTELSPRRVALFSLGNMVAYRATRAAAMVRFTPHRRLRRASPACTHPPTRAHVRFAERCR